jgi:hypothetical protein
VRTRPALSKATGVSICCAAIGNAAPASAIIAQASRTVKRMDVVMRTKTLG